MSKQLISDLTAVLNASALYTPPVRASGTDTITGTGAGDGTLGLNVDGNVHDYSVTAGDTPTIAGDMLVASINAIESEKLTASNAAGVITITPVLNGAAGNAIGIADLSTDTGFTSVVVDVDGGADPIGSPHSRQTITISSTALANNITINENLLRGGSAQLQLLLKTNMNWELTGFVGTSEAMASAINNYIQGLIYGVGFANGGGGGGAGTDQNEIDLDGDGNPDTIVVTQDSDSVNIDLDGDGNADIVIPT